MTKIMTQSNKQYTPATQYILNDISLAFEQRQTPHYHSCRALLALLMFFTCLFALTEAIANEGAFTWTADTAALEWGPCPEFMPEGCALAVLQGNPEEPNADVFFKLPGNTVAAHHWHRSAERMVLISGELHVDYDGQDPVVMRAGTYAYGPARLPHVAACKSVDPCVLFIAFEEPVDAIAVEDH